MAMARLREYRRVVGAAQLLYLVGRSLKRQGIKYTIAAALIALGLMVANIVGRRFLETHHLLPVTNARALLLPVVAAALTFGLGNTLTGLSNLFSSEKVLMADANAMNLLEDRKQAQMSWHLDVLWERVFRYEAAIGALGDASSTLTAGVGSLPADLCDRATGGPLTREVFLARAGYSLRQCLPQRVERTLTGCDLSLLEDWYDGAFFTQNDCKLKEQYAAHAVLRGIRRRVGLSPSTRIREALSCYPDPLWHSLTMKKIATLVGGLINRMNRRYVRPHHGNYFDAQDFLWNDSQADALLLEDFGSSGPEVLAALQTARQGLMRQVFSDQRKAAHRQVWRMFGKDYLRALELRLAYDVEFAAGLLDEKPIEEVAAMDRLVCCRVYSRKKLGMRTELARRQLVELDVFLAENAPELRCDGRQLRAVRIGYGVNTRRIRWLVRRAPSRAMRLIREQLAPADPRCTRRLCLLREHYELTRLQLLSYTQMIDELAEYA